MLRTVTQYSTFTFLGAAVILMLSFVVEKGIEQVDEMLVPCQHGTPFIQGKCRCEGTPFNGTYCSNCMCEHGVCSTEPTTPFSNSDYGCRCPTQSKRFGFLCDLCNTVDIANGTCKGQCKPEFFGAKCERTCFANLPYDNDNEVCNTMRSSGGKCNACNGHGTCEDGFCDCDVNWFDDGRDNCVQTCPGSPVCNGHGSCKLYGNTPGCQCERGWNGPNCDLPCPGMLETGSPCNDNGICLVDFEANSATCECLEKFRGEDCSIECPGDVVACNGHGTCDEVGVCTCQTNVKWSLPSCKCSDELTCNALGVCNDEEKCECFGNHAGKFCLECKRNWHGEDCDLYCDPYLKANHSDKLSGQFGCFGHGTCLEQNDNMYCTCNLDTTSTRNIGGAVNNYVSYYDSHMNCGECLPEYFPKEWVVQAYGLPETYTVPCEVSCTPATCNGKGTCNHDFGVPGESLCTCDDDHVDDSSFCTACEADWYPLDFSRPNYCNKYCAASGDLPDECDGTIDCIQCNGHGTCNEEGECLCTDGYTGDECQIYCTSEDGLTCGGHGTCESNEIQILMEHEFRIEGGIPLFGCTCDPQDPVDADSRIDWDERLALGLVNGTLDPPPSPEYYGETCTNYCEKPPWEDSDECNGMGNCTIISIIENGRTTSCNRDSDCTSNEELMRQLSSDSTWKANKGPFCYKRDEITGCERTTNDCYEILLKQRPLKMRSEDCAIDTCLDALNQEDWKAYCDDVSEKKQPSAFHSCKSVESFCPAKTIPTYCNTMLSYTDGSNVSYKLDLAYEFDKRRYPSKITEAYRSEISTLEHDEAYAEFENAPDFPVLPDAFCPEHGQRYPQIDTVRENKQYLCDGVLVNSTNCAGTLEQTVSFYTPFLLKCQNSVTGYHDYTEALQNRQPGCKVVEQDKTHVFVDSSGVELIDATCRHINAQFPSCTYPEPCDFNPCSPDHTCENNGNLAICTTTGDLNSTCGKGVSTRLSYTSYSCDIQVPETSCPKEITFNTNLPSHCLNHNPIRTHIESIGEGETKPIIEVKHIHFEFKASELVGTSTILEFSDAIAIYVRQGQIQLNEIQGLQACPIQDQQCHLKFMYETGIWYRVDLELNTTHVTMTYNGNTVTKPKLSQTAINSITTVAANSIAEYRNIVSEVDIPSPFNCDYETCNLDVSYRSICSDIIRNVHYPSLLEPQHHILEVCSTMHEKSRLPDSDYNTLEQMYALDWDVYCNFYNSLQSSLDISHADLENYNECREFIDPLDGQLTCIQTALGYNWSQACSDLDHAKVPDNLKTACPNRCYNHLFDTGDFCEERSEIFENNTKVIDTCDHDWYNYCLMDAKGSLQGICSAAECDCDKEQYEGVSGESCELHCPMASDGSACAENSNMGLCDYTRKQKEYLDSGKLYDPVWALEGECKCFLSEGTRACDIECTDCNDETYGQIQVATTEAVTYNISANDNNNYIIGNENDPSLTICTNAPVTFVRNTSGHALRIVKATDCDLCDTGIYQTLPNSSLSGWVDVEGLQNETYTFFESGQYYYVCTAHENMVGLITVAPCFEEQPAGQIGMCNNARGVCECLPPFTTIEYETSVDWRGNAFTSIQRVYNMPNVERDSEYRLRMMQGAESYIKHSLEVLTLDESDYVVVLQIENNEYVWRNITTPTVSICANYDYTFVFPTSDTVIVTSEDCENLGCAEGKWNQLPSVFDEFTEKSITYSLRKNGVYYILSRNNPELVASVIVGSCQGDPAYTGDEDWQVLYEKFLNTPEIYWCLDTTCGQGDVSELANLDGTTSRYNYDCNKICPGTDETTKIPCNGRGYCTVVGSCVCEPAKTLKNTDSATIQKYQIIPGVEITEVSGGDSSLETTGFRGDDCSIICPGFDPILSDMNTICNGHGICDIAGQCACDAGYIGDECQFKCPFADGSICAGHGTCEMSEIEITLDPFATPAQTCLHYATKDACQAYSIINNMTLVDVSGTKIVGENEACVKVSEQVCNTWGKYQYTNYTYDGTIHDESKPSGCIEVERKLYFNTMKTDISCGIMGINCICETDKPDKTYCTIDDVVVVHVKGGSNYTDFQGKYEGLSYNFKYREMFQGQCIASETFVSHAVDKTCSTTHKIDVGDNLDEVDLETCKIYCLSNKNCAFFDYDGTGCNMYTQCTLEDMIGRTVYQEVETNLKFDHGVVNGTVDEKVYKCYQECQTHVGFIINTGTGKCLCEDATSDCTQVLNEYVRYDIGQVDYQHAKQLCDSQPCMGLQEDPPGSDEWYAMESTDSIKIGSVVSFKQRDQCENGNLLGIVPDRISRDEREQICAAMCAGDEGCNFFTMGGFPYEFRDSGTCQTELSERECTLLADTEMLEGVAITYNNGCKHGSAPICRITAYGVIPCYAHSFCSKRDLNRIQDGLNWNSKTLNECAVYGSDTPGFAWRGEITDSTKPYGCILTTSNNFINFNSQKSTTKCSNVVACIQYDNLKTDFVTTMSYTRDECEAYMTENDLVLGTSIINNPHPGPGICENARFVAHEDTADACSMRCVHDPTCTAFSFNGSTCYLSDVCTTRPWNGYSYDLTEYRRQQTCNVMLSYNTRLEDCTRLSDRRIDTDCDGCQTLCSDDSKCRGYTCEHTCVLIEREIDTCVTGPNTFFKDMIYMGEINSSDVSSGCIIDEHRRVYENVDNNTVACGDVKNLTVTTHVPEANHKQKPGMCIEDVEKWGWGELPRRGYEAGAWRLIKPGYNLGQNYEEYTVDDVWECLYQKCKGKYASHNSDWSANQCRCGYTLRDPSVRAEAKTYERMRPDSEEGCISMCEETPECVASSFDMMEYRIKDTNVPLLMGDGIALWEMLSGSPVYRESTLEACRIGCQNDADCMGYSFGGTGPSTDCYFTSTQPQLPLNFVAPMEPYVTYSMGKRTLRKVHLQDKEFTFTSYVTPRNEGEWSSHTASDQQTCEINNLKRDGYEYKYTTECNRRLRDAGWLIGRHTSGVAEGFTLHFNRGGHLVFSPYNTLDYLTTVDYRSPCIRQRFEYEADGYCTDERDKIQHHAVTHQECEERCADDNDCVAFSFFDDGASDPACSLSSACTDITASTAKTYRVDAKYLSWGNELTGNPLPKDATTKVTLKRGHAGRHFKGYHECSDTELYEGSGWTGDITMTPTERYKDQKCDGGVQKLYGNGDNSGSSGHERCYKMCSNYSSFSLKDNGECWCHEFAARSCTKISDGDWDIYQIDGSYEDTYNRWVDRAFDYCMDNYPTTKFVSVWYSGTFRCFETCEGIDAKNKVRLYSKAGLPALHLYYNDTLQCTATFSDMSDLPGQVSPDTLKFGNGLLGTMTNTALTMPKCVHSKKCNMKIGHPIDYEHHCYSTDSADVTFSSYTANLEQCIQYGLDTGARYVSYNSDNEWCTTTKVCEETQKWWNDDYVIYDLHQLNGTTTMKEPKEIKRFSGQDGDKGLISNNPTGGPNNYINNKQTYGGYSEYVKGANGGIPRINKGDIMNNHFLGNGYCEDAYRVYVGKYTFDDCWNKCKGETKCTAFSFGQYAQHLPTCALSTMCRDISKQQIKSKAQCQEMAIKANEAFSVVDDSSNPSGCYYKDQYVWNTDENMNYFEDYIGDWVKLPIGNFHILGSGYGSYTSVTSQEECITTCEENGYSLSSFATNSVKCRCGHVGTDHQWYDYESGGGMGVYMLGGTRPATMNNAKSWSIHPVQESVDPQLPNTTYDGEGKCLEGYDKIDSRYMTVGTCAVQCGKDPKCDSFSFSTWGGHEFISWGYPNDYMRMYDGRGASWNTNEGTWDETFDNCFEACATEKRDKNSAWHNNFYDSVAVHTNPVYKGRCYCANAWRYSPATDYVLDTTYTTHRIVPSCILSTTCSRTIDTFGWSSYKVKRVKKRCKEGTIQINEKCYDKVARYADHYSDGIVKQCVIGDCDSVSNQCTSEGGRLAQNHEYNAWVAYMNKMGKDGGIADWGLTDNWLGGSRDLHGYGDYHPNFCCSKPNDHWFLCITEMEEVIDKIANKVSEGVLKHSYVIVNATKETCADACSKPKYQYAFKGECNGVFTTHALGIEACYDTCKAEGAKSMTIGAGQCYCKKAEVNTCMRINKGANSHTYTLNEYGTMYASYGSECRCSNRSDTIQTNAQVTQAGLGDFSVSEAECEAFAVAHTNLEYQLFEASSFPNSPTGCFMESRISSSNYMRYYYYNRAETNVACATNGDLMGCIKTNVTDMHMFKVSHANWTENGPTKTPVSSYYVSRSGYSDLTIDECEAYSSMETGSWNDRPYGCIHSGGLTHWNTHDTGLTCASFPCVKRLDIDSYLMDVPEAGRSYSDVYTGTEFNFGNSLIHSHWAWLDY